MLRDDHSKQYWSSFLTYQSLNRRVKDKIISKDWEEPKHWRMIEHKLLYRSSFSETKLRFAILKATVQFKLRKYLGACVYRLTFQPFEHLTDFMFELQQ